MLVRFGSHRKVSQRYHELVPERAALRVLEGFDGVLDVLARSLRCGVLSAADLELGAHAAPTQPGTAFAKLPPTRDASSVARALALRHAAKRGNRFAEADAIRVALAARRVTIEDTQGVRWRR